MIVEHEDDGLVCWNQVPDGALFCSPRTRLGVKFREKLKDQYERKITSANVDTGELLGTAGRDRDYRVVSRDDLTVIANDYNVKKGSK